MKIAVMGYGTIGSGVVEVLEINKEKIAKRAGEPIEVKHVQHASLVLCVLIILSTMFIKQHSVFDVSTAFMLAFVMYNVVYIKNWMHLPQKSGSFQDTANSKVRV